MGRTRLSDRGTGPTFGHFVGMLHYIGSILMLANDQFRIVSFLFRQ